MLDFLILFFFRQDELTIELAVFADDAMWRHFQKLYGSRAEVEMHRFILAAVNNVGSYIYLFLAKNPSSLNNHHQNLLQIDILYAQRTLQPRLNVKIVRYEVHKRSPVCLFLVCLCDSLSSLTLK